MTLNRRVVMKEAWYIFRKYTRGYYFHNPITFSEALKQAWSEAKAAVESARVRANMEAKAYAAFGAELEKIDNDMFLLNMKDRWSNGDHVIYRNMQAERERLIAAA